jgi:hypothetical protein
MTWLKEETGPLSASRRRWSARRRAGRSSRVTRSALTSRTRLNASLSPRPRTACRTSDAIGCASRWTTIHEGSSGKLWAASRATAGGMRTSVNNDCRSESRPSCCSAMRGLVSVTTPAMRRAAPSRPPNAPRRNRSGCESGSMGAWYRSANRVIQGPRRPEAVNASPDATLRGLDRVLGHYARLGVDGPEPPAGKCLKDASRSDPRRSPQARITCGLLP